MNKAGFMRKNDRSSLEGSFYRELRLLEEIEDYPEISQRNMADRLGVALGVANLLTKNLIKKGYVKATKVGWRTWVYSLTPDGFNRKIQLTKRYIGRTLEHYRNIRAHLRSEINQAQLGIHSSVAILGSSELAELVCLALKDVGVDNIQIFDDVASGDKVFGEMVRPTKQLIVGNFDRIVVARSNEMDSLQIISREELLNGEDYLSEFPKQLDLFSKREQAK